MRLLLKGNTKDTTQWLFREVTCFNYLRTEAALRHYTEGKAEHIGTFVCAPKCPRQHPVTMECLEWNLRVLRKAQRVIPLLKHVKLETVFLDKETHSGSYSEYTDRTVHVVTVPATGIPADEALTAVFMARDFLDGTFRTTYANIFGGVRRCVSDPTREPLLPGYNPNKFWGNNKYFTAVLYFLMAFQPYKTSVSGFFNSVKVVRPQLALHTRDNAYWTNNRTSLYSILRFAMKDGYNFVQDPIKDQQGYIRDSSFDSEHVPEEIRQAVSAPAIRRYEPCGREYETGRHLASEMEMNYLKYSISNLLTVGEQREFFELGHRYAIENFLTEIGRNTWHMTDTQVLELINHLIDILNNDTI